MRPVISRPCVAVAQSSVKTSSFAYLTHGDRQRLDNLLMRHGNDTLTVDLNDPVADANAAALGYAAPHQAADLRRKRQRERQPCGLFPSCRPLALDHARHSLCRSAR